MNKLLLHPTDVLFFKDGRPMTGGLAGHGAAWPLPTVTSTALLAAFHRARWPDFKPHPHHHIPAATDQPRTKTKKDSRKFGCLVTAGPFPVRLCEGGETWFFPRPADAQAPGSADVTHHPLRLESGESSLPLPLVAAVVSAVPLRKDPPPEPWLSTAAFAAYLRDGTGTPGQTVCPLARTHFRADQHIFGREANIGIGIDPLTETQDGKRFYSAHYLRLREGRNLAHSAASGSETERPPHEQWNLGVLAEARDEVNGSRTDRRDLVFHLIPQDGYLVVGGQQRVCTATRADGIGGVLPCGLRANQDFHRLPNGKFAVKWVLLSPAVWPEILGLKKDGKTPQQPHPGGWLPNWVFADWDSKGQKVRVHPDNGKVLLTNGLGRRKAQRLELTAGGTITARLVAAIVPKPLVVTGWALPHDDAERPHGGAKSTHLAVPAGAVYYFEADSEEAAVALACALNWHGASDGTEIKNRRSTLLGEKGFGLGLCGTWKYYAILR